MSYPHIHIYRKLTDDYSLSDPAWALYNPDDAMPYQGWKLYITPIREHAEKAADAILPKLRRNRVPHKIWVRDGWNQEAWLPGTGTVPFIVIYCQNGRQARELAEWIDRRMHFLSLKGPEKIYRDQSTLRFGMSEVVRYRYGTNMALADLIKLDNYDPDGHVGSRAFVTPEPLYDLVEDRDDMVAPYFIIDRCNPFSVSLNNLDEVLANDFSPDKKTAIDLYFKAYEYNSEKFDLIMLYDIIADEGYEPRMSQMYGDHLAYKVDEAPYQGWQLSIPASADNARQTLEIATKILKDKQVPHMIRKSLLVLPSDLSTLISVYCRSGAEARVVAEEMDKALAGLPLPERLQNEYAGDHGSRFPTAQLFGRSGRIWYHYGTGYFEEKWHEYEAYNLGVGIVIDPLGRPLAEATETVPHFMSYNPFQEAFDPELAAKSDFSPTRQEALELHGSWYEAQQEADGYELEI